MKEINNNKNSTEKTEEALQFVGLFLTLFNDKDINLLIRFRFN